MHDVLELLNDAFYEIGTTPPAFELQLEESYSTLSTPDLELYIDDGGVEVTLLNSESTYKEVCPEYVKSVHPPCIEIVRIVLDLCLKESLKRVTLRYYEAVNKVRDVEYIL